MKRPTTRLFFETLEAKQLLAADGADLVADSFRVQQNSQDVVFDVLANDEFDSDYAGDKVITDVSLGDQGGMLSISEDGKSLLYDAPADASGRERFTYFVDGDHSQRVTVTITAPLRDDEYNFVPDRESYELDVQRNDPFWEGYEGPGIITLVSASSNGAEVEISPDGKSLRYTRLEHTYGKDSLIYVVDDRYPANVSVDIADPLDDDEFQIVHLDPVTEFTVVRDDPFWRQYPGAKQLTHVLDVPEGATASIAADKKTVIFDPGTAEYGVHYLRYVVDAEFEGRIYVNIARPVRDDYVTVDANSRNFEVNLLDNDKYYDAIRRIRNVDVIDVITDVTQSEQGGTVVIAEDAQGVIYTPPEGYVGDDKFTYTADGKHIAEVNVTVRDPLADNHDRNDYFTNIVLGSTNNKLDVLKNDFFGDGYTGDRLITKVEPVEGATVEIAEDGKSLLFTPHDELDTDEFSRLSYAFDYEVDNALTATVQVRAQSIARTLFFEYDQRTQVTIDLFESIEIPESYAGEGVVTSVTQPANEGTAEIVGDGQIRVQLGVGAGSFEYTIDGKYTGTITTRYERRLNSDYEVVHQNTGDTTTFDVLENDFDSYSEQRYGRYRGAKLITGVSTDGSGVVAIAADGRSITYKPAEDFVGTETVTYVVDDHRTATVQVDVARLLRHDRVRVAPNSTGNQLNVLGNDLVGGDYEGPLLITGVAPTSGASVSIAEDGKSIVYSPVAGFVGTDVFEYTVDDQLKANVTVEVHADSTGLLPKFESLSEFQKLVRRNAEAIGGGGGTGGDFVEDGGASVDAPLNGADRIHSETNVQVEGVDEADLIETDDDYIYTLTHGQAVITKAWPADQLEVVSRTDIKGEAIGQYLHGDRLTVISQEPVYFVHGRGDFFDGGASIWPYPIGDPITYVTVLDVSDRAAPKLVQRTEFEGNHVQTRRIDDYVYVVVRDSQSLVPQLKEICDDDGENCRFETNEELLARIDNDFPSVVEDLLPSYESYGPDDELVRTGLLVQPEDIFQPLSDNSSSLVTVAAINVSQDEPGLATTSGALTTGASELYVTTTNLYVFENHYSWQDDSLDDSPATRILKFELDKDSGGVRFSATGQVPGRLLDQFSADEYDGHLRLATSVSNTRTGNYSGQSENALFVMRDDEGILEHVGTLQNLALNETIQSVRYFGDRALVTTFQNVDPLFSVSLTAHESPAVEGYLTLPGYSSYMQYVSQDKVLTIGRSSARQWGGAAVISLFDVSNILQPKLIDQFDWGTFSSSVAETDHHAFGWFSVHGTLAVPAQASYTVRTDEDGDGYKETATRITDHTLHAFGIDTSFSERNADGIALKGTVPMDSPLLRSAFIDDKLYAVATDSIKSTNIATPNDVIDEVDISNPDPDPDTEPDPPVVDPLDPKEQFAENAVAARAAVASAAGVADTQVMLVSAEADDESTRMLIRSADQHYVFDSMTESVEAVTNEVIPSGTGRQFDWHNDANPFDSTGDGEVTARDALVIINLMNRNDGPMRLPESTVVNQIDQLSDVYKADVTGDGFVTALDVLRIVNFINAQQDAAGEPAASTTSNSPAATDAVFAVAMIDDREEENTEW